jgi:hypothetical protein
MKDLKRGHKLNKVLHELQKVGMSGAPFILKAHLDFGTFVVSIYTWKHDAPT